MPLDRASIDQQLQDLGEGSRWWNHRELRDLPAVLHADERILAMARGKLARLRWVRRPWLIVVTNQRLLCLRSSGTSWRQLEVAAGQITRVAIRIGPFRGRVIVAAGRYRYRLLAPREDAYRLAQALHSLVTPQHLVPGFAPTQLVRRVFDHVLALPAAAFGPTLSGPPAPAPAVDTSALEQRLQLMEDQVLQLQQQVDFLEQLLRERSGPPAITEERRPA